MTASTPAPLESVEPVAIRAARAADRLAVEALLTEAGLPLDGVAEHFAHFLVAQQGGHVAGAVGREPYGEFALVRSLAVQPALRGCGVGVRLVNRALDEARAARHRRVFLRTETAAEFFLRFGFRPIDPGAVAASVQQSVEFQSAHPDSCVTMEAELG